MKNERRNREPFKQIINKTFPNLCKELILQSKKLTDLISAMQINKKVNKKLHQNTLY